MKKLLFFISLFIFFIVPVKADSCIDLTPSVQEWHKNSSNFAFTSIDLTDDFLFELSPATQYTMFFNDSQSPFSSYLRTGLGDFWLSYYNGRGYYNYLSVNKSSSSFTFTTSSDTSFKYYFRIMNGNQGSQQSPFIDNIIPDLHLVEGSVSCSPTPDESIYSNFLTLYIDRFNFLANGFTTNPYLLSMIGIIFAWIVLELLLHLIHIKGGYKK